jgi:hypothetical protein
MPCKYHLESIQELVGDDLFMLETPSGRRFLSSRELCSRKKYRLFLFEAWSIVVAMPKTAADWRHIVDRALDQSVTKEGN